MNKVKYLLRVFRKMSFKKMFSTINEINKRTNKSKIYLFFDIINCALRYQSGYVDYLLFEMWNLNHKERETVLTRGKNNIFVKYYNDNKNYGHTFLNKNEFNEKFKKYLNREYIILNNNEDEFNKFIKGKKQIFCKPINGTHGDNMEKISPKEFKGNLYEYLLSKNLKLVEEVVIQCDDMNKLYPYAINTVRVITVHRYDGKVKLVAAYQRIGNHGYIVDNYNGGGMVVPIEEDGTIKYPAVDKLKNVYYEHPMTNTKIVGFKVPMYKEAVDLAMKASKIIKEVRYVGWDIAITKKGPTIIEGNEYPGHDIYQLPVHRENNIGVLPKFESALGKIKDLRK